jgi:predicted cobalt transporter CbtA
MLAARTLLVRGMLVGLAAGVLAYLFATLFGEAQIGHAIAFENAQTRAAGEAAQPELVSRTVQSTLGLATAVLVYGAAFGGLFALAFAIAYGRIGRFGVRATSALVALVGFATVEVVPFVKYPANPPAIGNPDTIGRRTALYFLMIVISVASAVVAVYLGRRLAPRFGSWDATLLAVAAFVVFIAAVLYVLPTVDEVPADFPATVLWRFRLASLGTQLVVWTTFGLLFGALTERSLQRTRHPERATKAPAKPH